MFSMSKIVVFGAGKIAEEVHAYLRHDSPHEVVAFTVDGQYIVEREKRGLPVVPFEDLINRYPPDDFEMFVAIGYQDLNRLRAAKYSACKALGYRLISYICSRASNIGNVPLGDNCLVLENATIQTTCSIGNNVFIWSGNHVGHHATIQDHNYLCGHVIIGGGTVIESHCFLGINSTIGHEVRIGTGSFIGAGTLVTKSAAANSVFLAPDTPKFRLNSEQFLRITKMR
jgi:sugar O-acyltransferase (sialic acid O-acetyltransferase NeuD family)